MSEKVDIARLRELYEHRDNPQARHDLATRLIDVVELIEQHKLKGGGMIGPKLTKEMGLRLRDLRKYYGLSQQQVEKDTGIAQSTIAQIESGKKTPRLITLLLVLRHYRTPPSDFFAHDEWVELGEG